MNPFVEDLRFAGQAERAARIELLNGQVYEYAGVMEVDEANNWVKIHNPQVMGDSQTFARIPLDLISMLIVTA